MAKYSRKPTSAQIFKFFDYKEKMDGVNLKWEYEQWLNAKNNDQRSEFVKQVICEKFEIDPALFSTKIREQPYPEARAVYSMIYSKVRSLKEIGAQMGGRDHSTIIYSMSLFSNMWDTDPVYKEKAKDIFGTINVTLQERVIKGKLTKIIKWK